MIMQEMERACRYIQNVIKHDEINGSQTDFSVSIGLVKQLLQVFLVENGGLLVYWNKLRQSSSGKVFSLQGIVLIVCLFWLHTHHDVVM
jgi:hypothetical protein